MQYIAWLIENFQPLIVALNGALVAVIALFLIIPGDQPEKFLQGIVNFLGKFSAKPSTVKIEKK
jgi:hypothetical protein